MDKSCLCFAFYARIVERTEKFNNMMSGESGKDAKAAKGSASQFPAMLDDNNKSRLTLPIVTACECGVFRSECRQRQSGWIHKKMMA